MKLKHFQLEADLDNCPTFVACLGSDLSIILGYVICTKEPFYYIKKAWRESDCRELLMQAVNAFNKEKETVQ